MMAWYEDIKALTEKTPEELSNFIRGHARTYSRSSQRSSSDGMIDEEDDTPFAVDPAVSNPSSRQESFQNKSHTGGRFPSDIQVNAQRGLLMPLSPTSSGSGPVDEEAMARAASFNNANRDRDTIAAAGALPGSGIGDNYAYYYQPPVGQAYGNTSSVKIDQAPSHAAMIDHAARQDGVNPYNGEPIGSQGFNVAQSPNPPVFVAGPMSVGAPQTPGTSITSLSEDSDIPTSFNNYHTQFAAAGLRDERARAELMNGSVKQTSRVVQNGQVRPSGQRNNSVPHVPGEYPRSTPLGTPMA